MRSKTSRIILVVVLVALLLACAVVAGVYWATGPAVRCELQATGPARAGWSGRVVASGGTDRCYYLYVPPGYDPDRITPLVVSFHGFLSNPESHALITGWRELAEREGFLLAFPQGTHYPQRWNAGETWGSPNVDDVQFFRDMLADVSKVAAVDRSRVYVNGFSNGGGMTVRTGCEAADSVTAIATVAAAVVSLDNCNPSQPLPLLAFHGTEDPLVPYGGGSLQGPVLPPAADVTNAPHSFLGYEEWVQGWAEGNGCDPVFEALPTQDDVRGQHYIGCDDGVEVIAYTIEGGGHTWPGGWPIPAMGKTTRTIDATEEMWRFFQSHGP